MATIKRIGSYEIIDLLGAGGMGVVYKARDPQLGRLVALKVLLPNVVADRVALDRFEQEVRAVAALSHPNILAIHEFQREGETVYAVMELLTGPTLRQRLVKHPMAPRKAVEVAVQIARGLAAAHDRNLVHRDLKPENLAFSSDGQVKILDFGLVREVVPKLDAGESQTRARNTEPGVVLGTIDYMSPEQIRGLDVDHRSDLFSFGTVLYEMLTGRRAFDRSTAADTMSAILNEDPRDLSDSGVAVPPTLQRIVHRCLEKDPNERFHSARDLAFALENSTTTGAHGPPLVADSRSGGLWTKALIAAGAFALGAAFTLWAVPQSTDQPVRQYEFTQSGLDSAPAASTDETAVAFASSRDGVPRIYVRPTAAGSARPLTDGPDRLPRFFPDGQDVLFIRREGAAESAWRVSVNSGAVSWLLSDVVEADPSPDGQRIAFVRLNSASAGDAGAVIGTADADSSGTEEVLLEQPGVEYASVRWSPDGTKIAAISRQSVSPNATSVVIVDAASGQFETVAAGPDRAFGALAWTGDSRRLVVTQAATTQVYVPGAPGAMVLLDPTSDERRTLFYDSHLFGLFGTIDSNSRVDVLGSGQVVFDDLEIRQTLEEMNLVDPEVPARELTAGGSLDRQPAYSPDGNFVVFTSNRGSGNLDLWLLGPDGTPHQLTDDEHQDWDPAFTPDGQSVLWSSNRGGHLEIWKARINWNDAPPTLAGLTPISSDGVDAQNPTSAGDWVFYKGGKVGAAGLWKVKADGSASELVLAGALFGIPDVSPDGRYVLVRENDRPNSRATIRVVDVQTSQAVPFEIVVDYVLSESNADITRGRARWALDGSAIYFVAEDALGMPGIFKQDFTPASDTSATRTQVVSSLPGRLTESFGLAADGRIAVSWGHYTRNVMRADGVPDVAPAPASREPR